MAYDYGYGALENKLIELFLSGTPDFELAEELLQRGADVNAIGSDDSNNILSEILSDYTYTYQDHSPPTDQADSPSDYSQSICAPGPGPSLCDLIRFFLNHGFDVTKHDGCFGAQCLWALVLSTFDRDMIEATKLLLDAGARNRAISPASDDIDETPWNFISSECSYQAACMHDYSTANIYEAVYQIYQAVQDHRPYSGIDSYEIAIGKKIQRVLAERKENNPIFFSMDLPEFKKDNCYNQNLYFVYDGGVLISTPYVEFWTDTIFPDANLIDVSEYFEGIVGNTIERFTYDHRLVVKDRTHYAQTITMIEMDSGHKLRFSDNFGEAEKNERAAYFEILNENKDDDPAVAL